MIIDAHLHLFRAVSGEYPRGVYDVMAPPEREELAEKLLEHMAGAGVDRAIVVPLSAHDHYLGEILREFPGRFAGVGVFDSEVADPVADIERRVEEIGLQGLRVFRLGDTVAEVETLPTFPLLAAMQDLGLKLWFYADPEQLAMLDRALDLLPELDVVLNHLGFCPDIHAELRFDEHRRPRFDNFPLPPPTVAAVERIARHPRVHVHLSGQYAFSTQEYPHADVQPVVDAMYRIFGANRMLWASDYPWIAEEPGYAEQLALVDHYLPGLDDAERAAILGGTADLLFAF
jgi:L-fuconolactonase